MLFCGISGFVAGHYVEDPLLFSFMPGFLFSISIAFLNLRNFKQKILYIGLLSLLWPGLVVYLPILILILGGLVLNFLPFSMRITDGVFTTFAIVRFMFFIFLACLLVLSIFEVISQTKLSLKKFLIFSLVVEVVLGIIYLILPSPHSIKWMFVVGEVLLGWCIEHCMTNPQPYES